MMARKTVGDVLIDLLEFHGVDTVFGIPGVHTIELYRGLSQSSIRHVTPRHELNAGFMADGYARESGKPGVCLLITGPGLTNVITAMAQARADSVPMLVIAGVNWRAHHGHEDGHLHELPDQLGLMRAIALHAHCLHDGQDLSRVVARAFAAITAGRPGPVYIEIPIDVMDQMIEAPTMRPSPQRRHCPDPTDLEAVAELAQRAERPVLLAGGGAMGAAAEVTALAEALDAPVVTTINARSMLAGHPLHVPASPSLSPVRDLLAGADLVVAVGTQFGPTDYDMNVDGGFPKLTNLVRIDVDALQATRGVAIADRTVVADAAQALSGLIERLQSHPQAASGVERASRAKATAFAGLSVDYQTGAHLIAEIAKAVPGCLLVGDSTQLVYAGNCYADLRPGSGWFNASVGFGSLGYGPPAAIGAQLAAPDRPVVCIVGDGGFQFCLSELGTAMDERAPVVFLVWNNAGYQEIKSTMIDNGMETIGVTPSAPDFVAVAAAYGMAGERVTRIADISRAVARGQATGKPYLVEFQTN